MPIIKSAVKAARQNIKRQERLRPVKTRMKTLMKQVVDLAKAGKKDEGIKLLPQVFKAIDMAAKKHIIHPKNASRKKSLVARLVASKKK
jgi:small subunit ribosomal protein S20